jgi:phosphoglycolate phosphatase
MPEAIPNPKLCVFDLDGTLVDSLHDIAEALNHCLALLGLPTHPVDRYRYMVGEGVPKLCQRALGDSHPHLVERLAELARAHYRAHALERTKPFAGVPESVAALKARGVKLAVLSNKPHELTLRVVDAFWPANTFDAKFGYLEEDLRKPSPAYLLRICTELSVAPQDTWVIGDTPTDVATALAGGAWAVGVTWGFRTRDDLTDAGAHRLVDHPRELLGDGAIELR